MVALLGDVFRHGPAQFGDVHGKPLFSASRLTSHMDGILPTPLTRPCCAKPKLSFVQVWFILLQIVHRGVFLQHPKIQTFVFKNELLPDHRWSSLKKFGSGKTSSLLATTWNNLWAVPYFKKIYLRILYVFKPFLAIGRDNGWINACLVPKMNVEYQCKRRQGSQRTSNGRAPQHVVQVIEAKLIFTYKAPTPVV